MYDSSYIVFENSVEKDIFEGEGKEAIAVLIPDSENDFVINNAFPQVMDGVIYQLNVDLIYTDTLECFSIQKQRGIFI
jgi:hypothetical protein